MEKRTRIIVLWFLIIAGFLSHSLTDALPAFWGESIAAQDGPAPMGMITFMMSFTYVVPAIGILIAVYAKSKIWKIVNAVLACVLGVFCIFHMMELLEGPSPAQFLIMPLMAVAGILLAIDSVKYCKEL